MFWFRSKQTNDVNRFGSQERKGGFQKGFFTLYMRDLCKLK